MEASTELSDLITYYTYDPTTDNNGVSVSNETYAVAAELRKTVNEVGSALASSQTVDAPPVSVCVDPNPNLNPTPTPTFTPHPHPYPNPHPHPHPHLHPHPRPSPSPSPNPSPSPHPNQVCVEAYCLSGEKRSPGNLGSADAGGALA